MTHREIARRLGVSVTAVAFVREVREGISAHSRRALRETEIDHQVAASVWLAEFRGCYAVSEEITRELVKGCGSGRIE